MLTRTCGKLAAEISFSVEGKLAIDMTLMLLLLRKAVGDT